MDKRIFKKTFCLLTIWVFLFSQLSYASLYEDILDLPSTDEMPTGYGSSDWINSRVEPLYNPEPSQVELPPTKAPPAGKDAPSADTPQNEPALNELSEQDLYNQWVSEGGSGNPEDFASHLAAIGADPNDLARYGATPERVYEQITDRDPNNDPATSQWVNSHDTPDTLKSLANYLINLVINQPEAFTNSPYLKVLPSLVANTQAEMSALIGSLEQGGEYEAGTAKDCTLTAQIGTQPKAFTPEQKNILKLYGLTDVQLDKPIEPKNAQAIIGAWKQFKEDSGLEIKLNKGSQTVTITPQTEEAAALMNKRTLPKTKPEIPVPTTSSLPSKAKIEEFLTIILSKYLAISYSYFPEHVASARKDILRYAAETDPYLGEEMTKIANLIEKYPKGKDDSEAILTLMRDLNLNFFIPNGFYVYSFLKDSFSITDGLQNEQKLYIRSFKIVGSKVYKTYDKEVQIFYVKTIPTDSYGSRTLGLDPGEEKNHILILEDEIEKGADNIRYVINENRTFNFLNDNLGSYLSITPEFSWPYFERLVKELPQIRDVVTDIIKKEFSTSTSKEEIVRFLRRTVEIHELSHKRDDIIGSSSSATGLIDSEVAAYLSEIALSNIPYYNLVEIFGTYLAWRATKPANTSAAKIILESLASKAYQKEGKEWNPSELKGESIFVDPLKALEVLKFLSSLNREDLQFLAKEIYEERFNRPLFLCYPP